MSNNNNEKLPTHGISTQFSGVEDHPDVDLCKLNPLSSNIHIHVLLSVLHIILLVLVGRIWLKIKGFHL